MTTQIFLIRQARDKPGRPVAKFSPTMQKEEDGR